ncbi:MAG TPA: type II toxin-antitoxin system RelE/ParE family toxin [Cyclobacteriaceae bacterium]|nr:type II toxin-antitoxin system RelE/ParE family toxin [Cyclobacteriaceae bacterium]
MGTRDKPLVWLQGEIKTPPFSAQARIEVGYLLRRLQKGEKLSLPHSRPMPSIGARCHELRIVDDDKIWRIVHRIDKDAILILEVFQKKTQKTPSTIANAGLNNMIVKGNTYE